MEHTSVNMNHYDEYDEIEEFNQTCGSDWKKTSTPQAHRLKPKHKEEIDNPANTSFHNWIVFPDNCFMATGRVQKKITPGVYEVEGTPKGILFRGLRVVTDQIFELADSTSEKVVNSIENFWNRKPIFDEFGILFKRGIILYGPQGSGKTIACRIISKKIIERGGIVINTTNPNVTMEALQVIRTMHPNMHIVNLLEDIDSIIDIHGEHPILSLLDGENQVDGITNIATTNYPERLDPRLKNRPSRFDEVYKVDLPNVDIREKYLTSIVSNHVDQSFVDLNMRKWAEETEKFSIAHLRELVVGVLCLGSSYEDVLKRLQTQIKTQPRSDKESSIVGF